MINFFLKLLLMILLSIGLTACSLFSNEKASYTLKSLIECNANIELQEIWSKKIGQDIKDSYRSLVPYVSEDVIYVADIGGLVLALNRETGTELWKKNLKLPIGGGITAKLGMLVLGTLDGQVVALNEEDGALLWKSKVSSEILSSPQTNGHIVLVQSIDDTIIALDGKTGQQLWSQEHLQPHLTLIGSSTPHIEGESVFIGLSTGEAKALRIADGIQLWSSRVTIPTGSSLDRMVDIRAQPLIIDDKVFIVSFQGNIVGLDIYTGRVHWTQELSSYKSIAQGFGSLYLTDIINVISSLDQRTGAVIWRQDQLKDHILTAPITYNNYVVVGDQKGYIYLLSQVNGDIIGRYRVGSSAIKTPIIIADNYLYVLSTNGTLTAIIQKNMNIPKTK